jgi:hypothetical protein
VLGAALRGTIVEPGTVIEIANQTTRLSARLLAALSVAQAPAVLQVS